MSKNKVIRSVSARFGLVRSLFLQNLSYLPLPILVFFIDWRDKPQRMGGAPVVLVAGSGSSSSGAADRSQLLS